MLENIFHRKEIHELEERLRIPHDVGRKIRRSVAIRLPFMAIRSVIGGLADAERASSWIGPEAMPINCDLATSGGAAASSFDPEKFSVAVQSTLQSLSEQE
jgi:hypothetical protein